MISGFGEVSAGAATTTAVDRRPASIGNTVKMAIVVSVVAD